MTVGYSHTGSWSKNSRNNLLVWEWSYDKITTGAGTSYKFSSIPLLAAVEAEVAVQSVDSSKYIDRKFISDSGTDFSLRGGLEYVLTEDIIVRGGYAYTGKAIDMVYGLKDVTLNRVSFGLDYYFKGGTVIQLFGRYTNMAPSSPSESRSVMEVLCQLKLNSF